MDQLRRFTRTCSGEYPLYEVDVGALKREVDEFMLDFEEKEQVFDAMKLFSICAMPLKLSTEMTLDGYQGEGEDA